MNGIRLSKAQLAGNMLLVAGVLAIQAGVSGIDTFSTDFIWSVWLLDRLTHGEVLYRDMFFGATPLSIYLLQALSLATFGVESLSLVLQLWLCQFVLLASCVITVARFGNFHPWLFAFFLLLVSPFYAAAPYTPLAMALAGLALAGTMPLVASRPSLASVQWRLVLLGVFVGLCFCAKQNIGILIAAAVVLSLANAYRSLGWREFAGSAGIPVAIGIVVSMICCLLPILISGGLPGFLDFAFLGKGHYLDRAGISWADTLASHFHFPPALKEPWDFLQLGFAMINCGILLLPLAAGLAIVQYWRIRVNERPIAFALAAFAIMVCVSAYPRADFAHVRVTAPILFSAMWIALARTGIFSKTWRVAANILGVVIVLGVIAVGGKVFFKIYEWEKFLAAEGVEISTLHPYRWIPVRRTILTDQLREAKELSTMVGSRPTFLLFPDAARFYLLTGLKDPTPFDYPLVTAFGERGQGELIAAIESGKLGFVCVGERSPETKLNPEEILEFVEQKLEPIGMAGPCLLRAPPTAMRPIRR